MPSTRRSRKHIKWGQQATAQGENAGTRRGPTDLVDKAVPAKRRARFPELRAELAASFAGLSRDERWRQSREFKERLRAVCASDLEFRGFWQLRFEPLLAGQAPPPRGETANARRPAAAGPSSVERVPARAEGAILALVASLPEELSAKRCALVLIGSESAKIDSPALHRAPHYGALRTHPKAQVQAWITSLLDRGKLRRTTDGLLRRA